MLLIVPGQPALAVSAVLGTAPEAQPTPWQLQLAGLGPKHLHSPALAPRPDPQTGQLQPKAWFILTAMPQAGCSFEPCAQDASGRQSLFWAHDLHAGAQTLEQAHLLPREGPGGLMQSNPASSPELWSYLVQVQSRGPHTKINSLVV